MRFGRSVTLTPNTLTRILGKCGLIVPMFVRPLPIPNHNEPFAQYAPPSSYGSIYLTWFSIRRSVRITLSMLIRIPEKCMPTALRNAGQLRVSKRNTRSHNKVPHLFLCVTPHLAHGFPSNSNVQLPWLHTLCYSVSSRCQLELLQSIPRIVCQHITATLRAS